MSFHPGQLFDINLGPPWPAHSNNLYITCGSDCTQRPKKKKQPVFRVTGPYRLLLKPRIFFRFAGKKIILCILKGEMPFKMHEIIYFSRKKKCVPTLPTSNFQTCYPKHTYFCIWSKSTPNVHTSEDFSLSNVKVFELKFHQ